MKRFHILMFLAGLGLFSCTNAHKEPSDATGDAKSDSSYSFPHPANWASQHVEFYAKNGAQLAGTSKDCVKCHTGTQLTGSPKNVSCATNCHAPSLNPGQPLPRIPPVADDGKACIGCHAENFSKSKPHYPAVAGLCSTCHQVTAEHLKVGTAETVTTNRSNESCYRCHGRKDTLEHVHPALLMGDESCLSCHNPHGSDQKFFMHEKLDKQCVMCHDTTPVASKSVHGIISSAKSEKSCTNCHSPHSSANEKLLLVPKEAICLTCHDKEIQTTYATGEKRTIPNIKNKIEGSAHPHPGAVMNENNCTFCHSPHASENMFLLNKKYPDPPLAKYSVGDEKSPNTYQLCFTCHDSGMLAKDINADTTNFRNDTKDAEGKIHSENLHWFHVVNAAGDQDKSNGRSCYVCHDPHGSDQEHTIKTAWKMKDGTPVTIQYTANPKGGQCTKTCHDLHTYKREEE
ncbi:MAG: cytochrome c3 family protein [Bdellovibrionota bacterium]